MVKILLGSIITGLTNLFSDLTILGIVLALVFSAIWLIAFWPPLFKKPWTWAVLIGSTILAYIAFAVIQYPLRFMLGSLVTTVSGIMIAGFIIALISGLVAVGFKLIPVVIYRRRIGKPIDPKLGLAIGAVAGVGSGFLISMAALNQAYASSTMNFVEIWRDFLFVALHISTMAIAGYGVFKARGWRFWLLTSLLFSLTIYYPYLVLTISSILTQVLLTILAGAVTGVALWLRWRKAPSE